MAELVKPRRLNAEVAGSNPTMYIFFEHFLFSLLIIHDVTKERYVEVCLLLVLLLLSNYFTSDHCCFHSRGGS